MDSFPSVVDTQSRADWVIAEAKRSICEGVLYEPRAYFDTVVLPATPGVTNVIVPGNDGIIVNSEQFPVRVTHMLATVAGDERQIQNLLLRVRGHDTYYMGREPRPLPLWSNELPSIPDYLAPGQAVWHFARPFILSSRDTLKISASALGVANTQGRIVRVAFQGIGYITGRPYTLEGERLLTVTGTSAAITDVSYRNDGAEPIVIDTMITTVGAALPTLDLLGDTRLGFVQVQQVGNGTNQPWIKGLPIPVVNPDGNAQASLLGPDGGRALVHRIAGDGFVWEPGDGVDLDFVNNDASGASISVGFLGYIAVR